MPSDVPILYVVGGANGAGKSTFAKQFVVDLGIPYLCADEIAFELAGDRYAEVAAKAGRILLKRIEVMREERRSFILESTLSGKAFKRTFERFRADGFIVVMRFIYLSDPEMHVERVAHRVRHGGHHIPREDILRRYNRSLRNMWDLCRPVADNWQLICNDGREAKLVATYQHQEDTIRDEERYRRFLELLETAKR